MVAVNCRCEQLFGSRHLACANSVSLTPSLISISTNYLLKSIESCLVVLIDACLNAWTEIAATMGSSQGASQIFQNIYA